MYQISSIGVCLSVFIITIIDVTILAKFRIFGAKPDLLLIFVVFAGLFSGTTRGFKAGLIGGFLRDIFTLDVFPINTFIMAVTGFLAGALVDKISRESKAAQALVVFIFVVFTSTLHYSLVSHVLKNSSLNFYEYLKISVIPAGIYTALLSILVFSKLIDIYNLRAFEENFL